MYIIYVHLYMYITVHHINTPLRLLEEKATANLMPSMSWGRSQYDPIWSNTSIPCHPITMHPCLITTLGGTRRQDLLPQALPRSRGQGALLGDPHAVEEISCKDITPAIAIDTSIIANVKVIPQTQRGWRRIKWCLHRKMWVALGKQLGARYIYKGSLGVYLL